MQFGQFGQPAKGSQPKRRAAASGPPAGVSAHQTVPSIPDVPHSSGIVVCIGPFRPPACSRHGGGHRQHPTTRPPP